MINYTIIKGDTLWGIAKKHHIDLNNLLHANPQIINSNFILPGQIINIPQNEESSYVVKKGDTLWSISTKYNITLDDLLLANPQIKNPTMIFPNQLINIPYKENDTNDIKIPSDSADINKLETEVIRLVNEERAKVGRTSLNENKELSNVAKIKSQDFINNNYFSHTSPVYGTPFNMLRLFDIQYSAAAENIASGQKNAKEAINTWMNSPGHRANILSSIYNQIGVGVAQDNAGNLYWTQMFIRD